MMNYVESWQFTTYLGPWWQEKRATWAAELDSESLGVDRVS